MRWVVGTFGPIAMDRRERATRVLEEAMELAQAEGVRASTVDALRARVYGRPVGRAEAEFAGVLVTAIAYAGATGLPIRDSADRELARIEAIDPGVIRERHRAKVLSGVALDCDEATPDPRSDERTSP